MYSPRQRSFWPHSLAPDSDPSPDNCARRHGAAHDGASRSGGDGPDHHLTHHARARV
jgi:hypothetical protein